jgi:hypothetical protein
MINRVTTFFFSALLCLLRVSLSADAKVTGGHLKWMFQAKSGYAPYNSPFAPTILRGNAPGADRVVVLSQTQSDQFAVDALDIVSGQRIWDAILPFTKEEEVWPGVSNGNPFQFLDNTMNLAFLRVPGVLIAIDGESGKVAWQWPIPVDTNLVEISGWDGTLGMVLQGQPVVSPYFPTVLRPTLLGTLNATDGSLLWLQNATSAMPLTQAEASTYAIETIEGSKDGLLYSRAKKILLLNWSDGSVVWKTSVSLEGSVGTGQGANITHMRYIPQHPLSDKPERILLNANNWGFQRFCMLEFNATNSSAPATPIWRSKLPENALFNVELTAPTVDSSPDSEMFYYWANRTLWLYDQDPVSDRYLVGRRLSDGSEVWSTKLEPVGLPSAFYGRVFVTSTRGLEAIQGTSGAPLWTMAGSPNGAYTYETTPTFSNRTGILVASRCVDSDIPTLCMYSQFDPAADGTAAVRLLPFFSFLLVSITISI